MQVNRQLNNLPYGRMLSRPVFHGLWRAALRPICLFSEVALGICIILGLVIPGEIRGMELPIRRFLGSHGLASREVIALCDDPRNGLWIGTSSGLNLMNSDQITGFTSSDGLPSTIVSALCLDSRGRLWIGTDGGIVLRDSSGFQILRDGTSLSGLDFRELVPFGDGSVVACTPNRIFHCTDVHVKEIDVRPPLDFNDGIITAAAYDDSVLLIGTETTGLSFVDLISRERNVIEPIHGQTSEVYAIHPDSMHGSLVLSGGRLALFEAGNTEISPLRFAERVTERLFDFAVSQDGTIWAISVSHLWRISEKQAIAYTVPVHRFTMTAVIVDHEGSVWVGTSGDGLLQFYSSEIENLSHETLISPLSFHFGIGDSVFITTDRNVLLHDRSAGTTLEILPADTTLFPGEIWDMARLGDRLFVTGQGGLFEIDDTYRIVEPQEMYHFPHRFVVCAETVENELILGTATGVIRSGPAGWSEIPGIPETVIYCLETDDEGSLYAGTSGLGVWVSRNGEFKRHPVTDLLPSMGINCLRTDDTRGGLWIGTEEGLHYHDPSMGVRSWFVDEGLCNSMVTGLVFDGRGRLWIGTDRGVQLFLPDQDMFGPVYDSRIGLVGDEITTGRAVAIDESGGLWCGFFGGVSYLNTEVIDGFVPGPATAILRITYGDRPIESGERVPYGSGPLRIEYRERSLKWPEQTVFRYRLSHVDDDWVVAARREEIRYRFLPAGTHSFEISAMHRLSLWGPTERLIVHVGKPFWRTIPFMIGILLVVITAVWGVVSLRTFRLKRRQVELEELVSIRTGQLEEALDTVRELSLTDELTGLPNRRALKEQLGGVLERARRTRTPISVMVIDIDRFKSLNDNWGHVTGDSALMHLAEIMMHESRKSDIVCRWGGDEFIYVLHGADGGSAEEFAVRLRDKIEQSVFTDDAGNEIRFTASIGVTSILSDSDGEWEAFVARADRAMYEAKRRGKNQVVVDE